MPGSSGKPSQAPKTGSGAHPSVPRSAEVEQLFQAAVRAGRVVTLPIPCADCPLNELCALAAKHRMIINMTATAGAGDAPMRSFIAIPPFPAVDKMEQPIVQYALARGGVAHSRHVESMAAAHQQAKGVGTSHALQFADCMAQLVHHANGAASFAASPFHQVDCLEPIVRAVQNAAAASLGSASAPHQELRRPAAGPTSGGWLGATSAGEQVVAAPPPAVQPVDADDPLLVPGADDYSPTDASEVGAGESLVDGNSGPTSPTDIAPALPEESPSKDPEPPLSDDDDDTDIEPGNEMVDHTAMFPEYLCEQDFSVVESAGPYYDERAYITRHSPGRRLAAVKVNEAIPTHVCERAAEALRAAATFNNLRHRTNGGKPPKTGIVGHYDYLNNPTRRKCRLTKYTRENWNVLAPAIRPFLQMLNEVYRRYCPDHHRLQNDAIPPQHRLLDTCFSTLSVNDTFRTAKHTDKGDFRSGFGVVAVLDGTYSGCHLAFPALGKAFALKPGDVIMFDTSLEHGNTEAHFEPWQRLGIVAYFRTGLASQRCETEYRSRLLNRMPGRLSSGNAILNVNAADPASPPLYVPRALHLHLTNLQQAALGFAHRRTTHECGCIIAMGMGLGKTLVALALAFSFLAASPTKDVVIITPKSIIGHWKAEMKKWGALGLTFERLAVFDVAHPDFLDEEPETPGDKSLQSGRLIIVNPESVARVSKTGVQPSLVIADEGHKVSSRESKLQGTLNAFTTAARVVMSGTPLQNTTEELYQLIQWISPRTVILLPRNSFLRQCAPIEKFVDGDDACLEEAVRAQVFLCGWLRDHIFRARDDSLPPLEDRLVLLRPSVLTVAIDLALRVGPPRTAARDQASSGNTTAAAAVVKGGILMDDNDEDDAKPPQPTGRQSGQAMPRERNEKRHRRRSDESHDDDSTDDGPDAVSSRASSVTASETDAAPMARMSDRRRHSSSLNGSVSASDHAPLHLTAHPRAFISFEARQMDSYFPNHPELRNACTRYADSTGGNFSLPVGDACATLAADSSKVQATLCIAARAKADREQVVVFTQYQLVHDTIVQILEANGIRCISVTGQLSVAQRDQAIAMFTGRASPHDERDSGSPLSREANGHGGQARDGNSGTVDAVAAATARIMAARTGSKAPAAAAVMATKAAHVTPASKASRSEVVRSLAALSQTPNKSHTPRQAVGTTTTGSDRERATVLVLSTRVGAFGIDLTTANNIILFDSWWNPQVDQQAIARCYRRNQRRTVRVYRLCTRDTVEERVLKAQLRKLALFRYCVDGAPSQAETDPLLATTRNDEDSTTTVATVQEHWPAALQSLAAMRMPPPSHIADHSMSPYLQRAYSVIMPPAPPPSDGPAELAARVSAASEGDCRVCHERRSAHSTDDAWVVCARCLRGTSTRCARISDCDVPFTLAAPFTCPVCVEDTVPKLVDCVRNFSDLVKAVDVAFEQ
jgi:superfamily II DNA or RNA helicase